MEDKRKLLADLEKKVKELKAELKVATIGDFKKQLVEKYGFGDSEKRAVTYLAHKKLSFEIPNGRFSYGKMVGNELERFLDENNLREEYIETFEKTAEFVSKFMRDEL